MMKITAILLAAGRGKRMHSRIPKVLHKIGDKPLLFYSLSLLGQLPIDDIQVVIGYNKDIVKRVVLAMYQELKQEQKFPKQKVSFAVQNKMLGTGDAVRLAMAGVGRDTHSVLVINGDDSFLYRPRTIKEVLNVHAKSKADMTFITLRVENPSGLGRIVRDKQGKVQRIVEEKAATEAQKKIREVNDGVYVFKALWLREFMNKIPLSAVGEYYLTDLVEIGAKNGARIETYVLPDTGEWFGVNTKEELARANEKMRQVK